MIITIIKNFFNFIINLFYRKKNNINVYTKLIEYKLPQSKAILFKNKGLSVVHKWIKEIFNNNDFYNNWKNNKDINNFCTKSTILFLIGNNGVGKTTTIGKLGYFFKKQNKKVLIIGADSFRSGAFDQLKHICESIQINYYNNFNIEEKKSNNLIYKGINMGIEQKYDHIIIDTSGMFHKNENLVASIKKQINIGKKFNSSMETKVMWVNDSNIGEVLHSQIDIIKDIPIDFISLTKLQINKPYYNIPYLIEKINKPVLFFLSSNNIDELTMGTLENFFKYYL